MTFCLREFISEIISYWKKNHYRVSYFLLKHIIKTIKHILFRSNIRGGLLSINFCVWLSERQLLLVPVTSYCWEQLAMIRWSRLKWRRIGPR